jgi:3-methyl-2-oxobutanoate hydroxymethyltransferase
MVEAIVAAEIPVMGHIGLTPQSTLVMGGFRVQGRTADAAGALIDAAVALEDAGCFALVLEGMPDVVAQRVTEALSVPTIGIGAGGSCDGQVLVFHDLLGLSGPRVPKFVRQYADLATTATEAVAAFAADVRGGSFPSPEETYHAPAATREALGVATNGSGADG